jgi:tetratricopeptide (TPR) repeat protein
MPALALAREGWAAWQERAARRALGQERFEDAHRHIDRALRVRPNRSSTNLLAARIARRRGAYDEAEQYLGRCQPRDGQRDGETGPFQLEWLLLRCQRGEVDELSPELLAWVGRDHPDSAAILEALASVYMRQARYMEALRCLDRWMELAPDSVRALDWHGWVCNQLDHRLQAISDYERALELDPKRASVRQRLAEILVESSQHADAVPHLELLRQEQPDSPEVLVALARCRIVQSLHDEARALLGQVLDARPNHFEALLHLGKMELGRGQAAEAERWLRKALAVQPRDPDARYALLRSLQLQPKRQRDARKELETWKRDRRNRDRLVRLLRTELDLKPKDADLARETGELFLELGEDQRGLFWLHRALALNPRHAPTHRALIAYYERTNNKALADEHRRQLAALAPAPKEK